ncbi:MAG: diguanylate cyclase [Methylophilaceae bacterium]|nr:diguanylate cyclase [Methylophilaceae bacterium]
MTLGGVLGLEGLADAIELGLVITDGQGRIQLWNRWIAHHSGIPSEQAKGKTLTELYPELAGSRLERAVLEAATNNLAAVLTPHLHHSPLPLFASQQDKRVNRRLYQLIHVVPMVNDDQTRWVLVQVTDMTAAFRRELLLRQKNEELKRSNNLDALTGLANRRSFDETLAEEFRRAQRIGEHLALALIDIDHFKRYNDHYGHVNGDQCLKTVAHTLQSFLKRAGDLAARYGGEEFALILPGLKEHSAAELARDLCYRIASLAIPHEASPVASYVTISVGVTSLKPEIGEHNHTALISAADIALYAAKQEGRNRAILFSMTDGSFHACD